MHFTNSVYFREETVLSGLFGEFPSLSFINDELNEIAGFLHFDNRFEPGRNIPVKKGLYSNLGPAGLQDFVLPAVFLSHKQPTDSFLIEVEDRYQDNDYLNRGLRRMRNRRTRRLGEYDFSNNLITLYVLNIEKGIASVDLLKAKIRMVLAHELFHAYQHYVSPEKSKQYKQLVHRDGSVDSIVQVMEATADFFAFLWLTERIQYCNSNCESTVRTEMFDGWQKEVIQVWPYAGAKYCVRDTNDSLIWQNNDLWQFEWQAKRFQQVMLGFIDPNVPIDDVLGILIS